MPVDLRMARQDLFDQGRARARHSNDEGGLLGSAADPFLLVEKLFAEVRDQLADIRRFCSGRDGFPTLRIIACLETAKRRIVIAAFVVQLGQRKIERREAVGVGGALRQYLSRFRMRVSLSAELRIIARL